MASVRQIAEQAGVSTATVSRVINNSAKVSDGAREKVLAVLSAQDFQPAMGKISATNIAYIFTESITLGSPYDAGVLAGLSAGLEQSELDLLVLNAKTCRLPGETFANCFRRKGVRGGIVRTAFSSRRLCRAILECGLPTVVLGDQIEGFENVCIDVDSRATSRDAVEHLLELGHRRIGFCTNVVDDKDHEDRFAGYREAMEQAGMDVDPKLVFRVPANRQGGEQFARRLATMAEAPTALFVADPATCIGVLTEARNANIRVPGDLSVVGFDDSEIRFSTAPQLTAVCQDAAELGREAFDLLNGLMGGNDIDASAASGNEPRSRLLRAWLEVHGTTAAISESGKS